MLKPVTAKVIASVLVVSWFAVSEAQAADFVNVIPKLLISVVNISAKGKLDHQSNELSDVDYRSDGIKELFEFVDSKRNTPLGSGFIVDSTGYIVTNYHVVEGVKEVIITLHDDKEFKAKIVGYDEKMDIALLKIEVDVPLTPVEFGDSNNVRVGEWVLSVGNPYGFPFTVTKGIVSFLARNISARCRGIIGDDIIDYIQTDAPINRGNSGSPLFTADGKAIGMVIAIFSDTGVNSGLNFAIPSNFLQKAIKQLKAFGKMRRGWIGVSVELLEADVAESLGLAKLRGVTVTKVTSGSPGAKAGLQQGDIIVTIGDTPINDESQLSKIVANSTIGKVLPIKVRRDSQEITLSIMVGYRDDSAEVGDNALEPSADVTKGKDIYSAGLSLTDVSVELRKAFDLPNTLNGAVIINTMRNSNAAEKDIRQGDVIVKIDQTSVNDVADFLTKLMNISHKKDKVALLIYRDGVYLYRAILLRKILNNSTNNEPVKTEEPKQSGKAANDNKPTAPKAFDQTRGQVK
ncbi:MAG: trypsin-like peptidase domain-containing protein [Holosporales bacterium]|jgi:serine protease Do|nr:trypsin-like peptidase domain-containing protein [Holosporales bacterium]